MVNTVLSRFELKFMKFYAYIFGYAILNCQCKMYSRCILSYKNAPHQRKQRHAWRAYQRKKENIAEKQHF